MLLDIDDLKYLEIGKDPTKFVFFDEKGTATEADRKYLKALDSWYFFLYKKHLIENFKELDEG